MKVAIMLLIAVAIFALVAVMEHNSDSWCVAGKLSGPCDEWPMKNVPEWAKVHVK